MSPDIIGEYSNGQNTKQPECRYECGYSYTVEVFEKVHLDGVYSSSVPGFISESCEVDDGAPAKALK